MANDRDQEELEWLLEYREVLNIRIKAIRTRMDKARKRKVAFSQHSGSFTVRVEDVVPYIRAWIDEGYELQVLAEKANVSEDNLGRMLSGKNKWMREGTADAILSALNLPHVLDRIRVAPPNSKYYEE